MSKEKSLVPMLLGVAALAIAMVLGGVYLFSGYLVKQLGQSHAGLRRTPDREANVIETNYRGPMYPSGRRLREPEGAITLDIPVGGNVEVSSNEYITQDGLDEVIAYYRHYFSGKAEERLTPGGAQWTEKREDGTGVVAVKEAKDGVHIRLALIAQEPH